MPRLRLAALFVGLLSLTHSRAPTKPPGTPARDVRALGDPHLHGAHGDLADFRGEDGGIFNFLSATNLSLNVLIKAADFHHEKSTVHGTHIAAVYWTILTANNKTIWVSYRADINETKRADVHVSGSNATIAVTMLSPFTTDGVRVSFADRTTLVVVGARWSIRAKSTHPLDPWVVKQDPDLALINLEASPLYDADKGPVAPHGLFGQSFDGDRIGVDGARDPPLKLIPVGGEMTTSAQAEGAIEGVVADYKMASPHATAFKYSRYNATSAKPRDVSKLTGAKHKMKTSKGGQAAAVPRVKVAHVEA